MSNNISPIHLETLFIRNKPGVTILKLKICQMPIQLRKRHLTCSLRRYERDCLPTINDKVENTCEREVFA